MIIMAINDITTLITTCGFPIFACIYLAKTQAKQLEKLGEIINRNTKVIDKLREEMIHSDDNTL